MHKRYTAGCCEETLFATVFRFRSTVHCADEMPRITSSYLTGREELQKAQVKKEAFQSVCQGRQKYSRRECKSTRRGEGGGGGEVLAIYILGCKRQKTIRWRSSKFHQQRFGKWKNLFAAGFQFRPSSFGRVLIA